MNQIPQAHMPPQKQKPATGSQPPWGRQCVSVQKCIPCFCLPPAVACITYVLLLSFFCINFLLLRPLLSLIVGLHRSATPEYMCDSTSISQPINRSTDRSTNQPIVVFLLRVACIQRMPHGMYEAYYKSGEGGRGCSKFSVTEGNIQTRMNVVDGHNHR